MTYSGVRNLSHPLSAAVVSVFPGDPAPRIDTVATLDDHGFHLQAVTVGEHTGTHWGAPAHFTAGAATADRLDPEDFVLPGVRIDISARAEGDRDYAVTVDDLLEWQQRHGPFPAEAAVLLRTGWERYWGTAEFASVDAQGRMHHPGFFGGGGALAARPRRTRPARRPRHRRLQPRYRHRRQLSGIEAVVPRTPPQPRNPRPPGGTAGSGLHRRRGRIRHRGRVGITGVDIRVDRILNSRWCSRPRVFRLLGGCPVLTAAVRELAPPMRCHSIRSPRATARLRPGIRSSSTGRRPRRGSSWPHCGPARPRDHRRRERRRR